MDMQKLQVRADLERMVYNYALLGKIENDAATKIVSFIGLTIGGDLPELRGRIIAFPMPLDKEEPADVSQPPDEAEPPPFPVWYENFKDSGFDDYKYVGRKILRALYYQRVNSLEELANRPLREIMCRHSVGEKAIEIIRSVLEKNGFTAKDMAL